MPDDQPRDGRSHRSSRRQRHPELDPEPDPGISNSGVLTLDAVDKLAIDLTAMDGPLEPAARDYFANRLMEHPCRKCPHLVLVHPHDATGTPLPLGPLRSMPSPGCKALPEWTHDEKTGELVMHFRETWRRCLLFGIRSVREVYQELEKRIEQLEAWRRKQEDGNRRGV